MRGSAGPATPRTGSSPWSRPARLRYTEAQQAEILDHFIKGGDLTAGGIMHALTSTAQAQDGGDAVWDMESTALEALRIATTL
jgi:hypothetical protein